jgi:heme-degrading monooxygenase HmoA
VWVRMSTFQGSPNQSDEEIEQQIKVVRENILPTAQQMDGYKGVVTVGDRGSGKSITLTFWDTEAAMRASEEAADKLRQQAADETDEEIAGVERFEVYILDPPQG